MEGNNKIQSFTDLEAWKKGHALVLEIYRVTKGFPKEETYGLTNQLRRCAVSITSNIAEGFSRRSLKEKGQFFLVSQGSVTELQNQLLIAKDIGYLNKSDFASIANLSVEVHKILNSLIKKTKEMYS